MKNILFKLILVIGLMVVIGNIYFIISLAYKTFSTATITITSYTEDGDTFLTKLWYTQPNYGDNEAYKDCLMYAVRNKTAQFTTSEYFDLMDEVEAKIDSNVENECAVYISRVSFIFPDISHR